MIVLQLAMVTAVAGCASQSSSAPAPEADTFVPCAVRAAQSDSVPWREVSGNGFTFCVPADWRASGPDTWRGGGGSVSWDPRGTRIPVTVRRMDSRAPSPSPAERRETTETIDGQSVRLTTFRSGTEYLTIAAWTSGLVNFSGRAGSQREAELHLEIYRTVRRR
jgi:hypothetical protein